MALTYTNIQNLVGQQTLLLQMATAITKKALAQVGTATGNELALASAIIKNPIAYAPRFLLDGLILNAAGLTSTNGSTLDAPLTDATVDTAVGQMWAGQYAAGA